MKYKVRVNNYMYGRLNGAKSLVSGTLMWEHTETEAVSRNTKIMTFEVGENFERSFLNHMKTLGLANRLEAAE